MDKNAKMSKDAILKSIEDAMEKILKASEEATQIVYKSGAGQEYRECPGAYNSVMTRAIAGDIAQLSLFMQSKDEDMTKDLKNAADHIRECDVALRRMFDDKNDHRPISEFPAHRIDAVIETMTRLKRSGYLTCPIISGYTDKMDIWVEKAAKMTIWAFYCETRDKLDVIVNKADMRLYDDNNNLIYGISEKDAESVKIVATMEQILLKALVRIPFSKKECHDCVDRIELIHILINAIAEGNAEKLDILANYTGASDK